MKNFQNHSRYLVLEMCIRDRGNMDDWLIIDKIEDVVVGTSIPYNYEKSKLAK